jgi:Acetyltransferase (GNAT) domain
MFMELEVKLRATSVTQTASVRSDNGDVSRSDSRDELGDRVELEGETIFHSDWWLDAVAPGEWRRLTVTREGKLVGLMPLWAQSKFGIKRWVMPPFTHVFGPAVDTGSGTANAKMHRRFSITSELLTQIPRAALVRQTLDPSVPDVLAFQAAGYRAFPHYTIAVDCKHLEHVWSSMRQKTRRFIRRAEENYLTSTYSDIKNFKKFYRENLEGERLFESHDRLPALYEACALRDAGKILVAHSPEGELAAAAFFVWGFGRMYYLLTTRAKTSRDFGVVSLLIWRAMQEAHARSLVLDLDGITNQSTYHFLSGFGGVALPRMVVYRQAHWLEIVVSTRRWLTHSDAGIFY